MIGKWQTWAGTVILGLAATAACRAQAPAVPGVPAAPAVPGAAGAAATAAPATPAAPSNLWSFLCPTPDQCAACKAKFCASALGKMVSSMASPVSLYSGGLLGNCCPQTPTAADLAQPADSAGGAAARIKQQEAAAKKRREDVRYLGTVDCKRYPEAEAALIGALRGDTSECVRFEAALALNRGCCCTRPVAEALAATVSGTTKDHYPAETSPRVREAAMMALEHCLSCSSSISVPEPVPPEKPQPPERPGKPEQSALLLTSHETMIAPEPIALRPIAPTGGHSLAEIWDRSGTPSPGTPAPPQTPVQPARSRDLFTVLRTTLAGQ